MLTHNAAFVCVPLAARDDVTFYARLGDIANMRRVKKRAQVEFVSSGDRERFF